jgi:hypothetical protein
MNPTSGSLCSILFIDGVIIRASNFGRNSRQEALHIVPCLTP